MRDHFVSVLFGLLAITFVTPVAAGTRIIGTCIDVIDGDTIVIKTEGKLVTVTLPAVDAPELGQPFGDEARSLTSKLVLDREVTVELAPGGSPSAAVARIVVDETDLAVVLLEAGLAWHDAVHDSQEQLVIRHIMARSAKRGLWSETDPVAPWEWRAAHAPTPIPRKEMKLVDVAGDVELKKNADGKTVVTQPTPTTAGGSAGSGELPVTNYLGEEMCCCEVRKATGSEEEGSIEEVYLYQWQEKYACEHHAMQIHGADTSAHFFERCVNRSYCPE